IMTNSIKTSLPIALRARNFPQMSSFSNWECQAQGSWIGWSVSFYRAGLYMNIFGWTTEKKRKCGSDGVGNVGCFYCL
ncbi:MAG: hypothetical protein ACI4EY_04630, partial [Lachnospiraceae bacterium]